MIIKTHKKASDLLLHSLILKCIIKRKVDLYFSIWLTLELEPLLLKILFLYLSKFLIRVEIANYILIIDNASLH